MSSILPEKKNLQGALLFCFHLKKSAAGSHRIIVEAYGDKALSETTCRDWFRRFKSGNFDLTDTERENRPKKVEDKELQTLLDEDDTQLQNMLAKQLGVTQPTISMRLRALGKIQKVWKWVPHELNDRQMERRMNTTEICLSRQKKKSFLHRIVTGNEKWIYFENLTRKKSWVDPGQSSTSSSRPDHFGRKTMLFVWCNQQDIVYYELLKPGGTVNAHCYHQQLIKLNSASREKRPDYQQRHDKVILFHDNAPSHTSKLVQDYLKTLNWEVLPPPAYLPDLAPSDYHLFSSMGHALAEQHFDSYENDRKWLDDWFASKTMIFPGEEFIICSKDGKSV